MTPPFDGGVMENQSQKFHSFQKYFFLLIKRRVLLTDKIKYMNPNGYLNTLISFSGNIDKIIVMILINVY